MTIVSPSNPDFQAVFEAVPGRYLVVLPDAPRYTVVAASDAYLEATRTRRDEILGRSLFDGGPVAGAGALTASFARVVSERIADELAIERLEGVADETRARRWISRNSPVFGPVGEVAYIIHAIEDVTEQRLLDQAQSLFDQASDSIFIADLDGRFTQVNATACRMLGYSRQELLGKSIADIIPSEDVPRLAVTREQLSSRAGTVQIAEWVQLKKDGTPIPVEVSTKILSDGRWLAFVRDISERKRFEAQLEDANAFLDAIIENIPLMLFIKDSTSLQFVRFNRAGEALLGWSRDTLVGKSDFDFWPREQAEFFIAKDRETLNSGKVLDVEEEPIRTRHHGVRFLHTKKVPILDPSGQPRYLLGISEDVTEHKRIDEERRLLADVTLALSASLDYEHTLATVTRLAVQRVADWCAIDVMEEQGHLRRLKVASADPADAALCAELERLPPNRDLPHLARFIFENGRPFILGNVTPDYFETIAQGSEHLQALRATGITSVVGVPLRLRGRVLGVLMFASTNERRVYGQGDVHWAEAVADRAAVAMENARLYRASIQASQLRDQVLGVVAHDLRNPLSAILLHAGALRERSGLERELGAIYRAATRMNRLIQDLLDVSLVDAGRLPIRKARLSARNLVVEGVELQRMLAGEGIELRIDVGNDTPEVWGDRDRLLQVFENLIGNAIKFSAAGGRITVGTAATGHEVLFWVADDGRGIAPDALQHVFERYWQAATGEHRGAGLGLSIVKGIVEAHGGRVWAESRLGRGTTFYFTIPANDVERLVPSIH